MVACRLNDHPVPKMEPPVFRFAPSPNGDLHLGHALSAILNHEAARARGGTFLVRIEDIDPERARPHFIERQLEDLAWLGLAFEHPPRRQSEHVTDYGDALARLRALGLIYPSFASRADIRRAADPNQSDPDGAPLYPGLDRDLNPAAAAQRIADGAPHALRLDMRRAYHLALEKRADLSFDETGFKGAQRRVTLDPRVWGDVTLARKDAPASYHLAVVVDDAAQRVTDVIRGQDLFYATAIHRLLQSLLDLPVPRYRHHRLILDENGRKLSKSRYSSSLRSLRAAGATADDIRRMIGL